MGIGDKISNKAEDLAGKGKEAVGKATGDQDLEAEGKVDQGKSDLKQAVEKVKQFRPDLILMDLMMPVMDGIEATKIIRDSEDGRIPIIALTAYHKDYHHEALEAGCDGVIPKPINFDDLRYVIAHYLPKNP